MKALRTFFTTLAFTGLNISLVNAQSWSPPDNMQGNGTSLSPYEFTTIAQLVYLANYVNSGRGDSTSGKYYKLMNDIDLTGVVWSPIGYKTIGYNYRFHGNFDGGGMVVRNLTYYNSTISSYDGFFGITENATVVNLGIENCNFGCRNGVGGLACYASFSIISNCYVTGNVKGAGTVGGLVGTSMCTDIFNCYFKGNVSAGIIWDCVGGLVGSYVGGCMGGDGSDSYSLSIISNCYVIGKVSADTILTTNYGCALGGLVGGSSAVIIRNCVVALDSLIIVTNTTNMASRSLINRIVGGTYSTYPAYNPGILQNNYALNTMVVQDSNGNVPITSNLNTECGFSIPLDSLKSFVFYNRGINWYNYQPWNIQNPSGDWKICDGQDLPFLRWQNISCNYSISATAGKNGSISPAGTVIISDTASQKFTFSATNCYTVDSLWIDGIYKPDSIAKGSYTFKNVNENHSIKVSFKRLPPDTVIIKDTVCYGTDYTQNGFTISNAKTDSVYFKFNIYGCDTVTRLELTVNPVYLTKIKDTICKGDFYYFAGEELTEKGIYIVPLQTISGCDSVIELTLTVISIDTTQISAEICEGDSYDFFGCLLTEEDIYYKTLQSVHGCDSVIELRLTVSVGIVETNNYPSLPKIYPNPTTGKLKIESGELKMGNVELYDIYGKKQLSIFNFQFSIDEIDISHLSAGIYFLRIDGKTIKLIKE